MQRNIIGGILVGAILFMTPISLQAADKVKLTFTFWGSPFEKKTIFQMCQDFEKAHPNIEVEPLFTPERYDEKLSAMVAGGVAPDVAYCHAGPAHRWADKGVIMDVLPLIEEDPQMSIDSRIPMSWYWYDKGKKVLGSSICVEVMLLWYNKDIFDEFGVAYPPANPDKSWTWDEFLVAAQKLTAERHGQKTFGVSFGTWVGPLLPFIRSNEGEFFNEEVTAPLVESPETVEVLQKLSDLMNKYHVAPTPTDLWFTRSLTINMQTGQVAMGVDGQWMLLDLAKAKIKLGAAPVPIFKKPVCIMVAAPLVMFSTTKHLKEAWEFNKWIASAEASLPVHRSGLWMPLQTKWYKEPDLLEKWIDPTTHPPEYKQAVVDYLLKYGSQFPDIYIMNWSEIERTIIQGLHGLWRGKEDAKTAARKIAEELKPLLKGRTDR